MESAKQRSRPRSSSLSSAFEGVGAKKRARTEAGPDEEIQRQLRNSFSREVRDAVKGAGHKGLALKFVAPVLLEIADEARALQENPQAVEECADSDSESALSPGAVAAAESFIKEMEEVLTVDAHQTLLQMAVREDETAELQYVKALKEHLISLPLEHAKAMFNTALQDVKNEEYLALYALTCKLIKT